MVLLELDLDKCANPVVGGAVDRSVLLPVVGCMELIDLLSPAYLT